MPPARDPRVLTAAEQKQLEDDLIAARDRSGADAARSRRNGHRSERRWQRPHTRDKRLAPRRRCESAARPARRPEEL